MDVLTSEICWALYNEIKKASDIKLVSLYSTIKMKHGSINMRKMTLFSDKRIFFKSKFKNLSIFFNISRREFRWGDAENKARWCAFVNRFSRSHRTPPGTEHRSTAATSLLSYRGSSAGAVTSRRAATWRWNDGSIPEMSKSMPPVECPSCLLFL
jgi:hypothetical protein